MLRLAGALLLVCSAPLAAQGWTMEEAAKREQEALKRAKILRIVGIPGVPASLESAVKSLGGEIAGNEAKIPLAADTLFEAGKAQVRAEAAGRLQLVAHVLREFPAAPVRKPSPLAPAAIECHGEDAALSRMRAAAVRDWLVENAGIDPARLATQGKGGAPGGKESRVEITVRKGP